MACRTSVPLSADSIDRAHAKAVRCARMIREGSDVFLGAGGCGVHAMQFEFDVAASMGFLVGCGRPFDRGRLMGCYLRHLASQTFAPFAIPVRS